MRLQIRHPIPWFSPAAFPVAAGSAADNYSASNIHEPDFCCSGKSGFRTSGDDIYGFIRFQCVLYCLVQGYSPDRGIKIVERAQLSIRRYPAARGQVLRDPRQKSRVYRSEPQA